jgi:hypothetical protein
MREVFYFKLFFILFERIGIVQTENEASKETIYYYTRNMTSCEENAEGSWIPSLSMSILILLWWISRGQSARAVRIRRWYNTKVRRNTFCTIEFVFFASYCIDPEDR